MSKSQQIKDTMLANRIRRANMKVGVFEVKIDSSKLSLDKKRKLEDCFIQAKWLYNATLANLGEAEIKGTIKSVNVQVFNPETQKCDITEVRNLTIGSQIKQEIYKRTYQNLFNLKKAKDKGLKVGRLKFKAEVNSVPLKQFGTTYKIYDNRYIGIQGVGKLRTSGGLDQVRDLDKANAHLVKRASGYYLLVTCYSEPKDSAKSGSIGLDFGIKDSIVDSNGQKFKFDFSDFRNIKRKQKKLSRCKRGSKRSLKAKLRLQKAYEKMVRQKNDAANKFVASLKKYEKVVIQDESIKGWHSGLFGKKVQFGILGRIKAKIKNLETSIILNRWLPTTKLSPVSYKCLNMKLSDREFRDGWYCEDRDIKAAKTILAIGLYNPKITHKELMGLPVEEMTSLFSNFEFKSQSVESGSPNALA